MDRILKMASNNQEKNKQTKHKPEENIKKKNDMEIKIKLCWQSCRKELYQFLAHTALLPTDPEKPIFRFSVKNNAQQPQ